MLPPGLYLIPTPLGNLEDITVRATRYLKEVDLLFAEDTRTSRVLLQHLGIDRKIMSHHQHNEHQSAPEIVRLIGQGQSVGLVSDAGTPGISDPGFLLVREALKSGLHVECLPGPTAFVPALVVSGMPCDRFHFEGFLPMKKGRQTRLLSLARMTETVVLYESPHKIIKTLEQIVEFFGAERRVSLSREISKLHEETLRGTATELLEHFKTHEPRGEMVVVIKGNGN
ncbi:MAG: 16S rRNA (cytidine(1402)-2'-O)-methyltransferase [Bacteroidota bacterium]